MLSDDVTETVLFCHLFSQKNKRQRRREHFASGRLLFNAERFAEAKSYSAADSPTPLPCRSYKMRFSELVITTESRLIRSCPTARRRARCPGEQRDYLTGWLPVKKSSRL